MLHVSFIIPLTAMGWCALAGVAVVLLGSASQLLRADERQYFHYTGYRNAFILRTLFGTIAGAAFMALLTFVIYQIIAATG